MDVRMQYTKGDSRALTYEMRGTGAAFAREWAKGQPLPIAATVVELSAADLAQINAMPKVAAVLCQGCLRASAPNPFIVASDRNCLHCGDSLCDCTECQSTIDGLARNASQAANTGICVSVEEWNPATGVTVKVFRNHIGDMGAVAA